MKPWLQAMNYGSLSFGIAGAFFVSHADVCGYIWLGIGMAWLLLSVHTLVQEATHAHDSVE
jgi:hypothetical protein